jgi:hypothetical protein
LGKCLAEVSVNHPDAECYFFGRDEFPVDDATVIRKIITEVSPAVVINTAAYTAVDKAESDTRNAFFINGEAVGKSGFPFVNQMVFGCCILAPITFLMVTRINLIKKQTLYRLLTSMAHPN